VNDNIKKNCIFVVKNLRKTGAVASSGKSEQGILTAKKNK